MILFKSIKKTRKYCSGYVEAVTSKKGKYTDFVHGVYITGKKYSLFNQAGACFFRQGDLVQFDFVTSGGKYSYNKISEESMLILNPAEQAIRSNGYVYILSNPSMPSLVKIGFTTRTPEERAIELYHQATGVPNKFKVEWFISINGDPELIERKTHALLAKQREGKEFFNVSVEHARKVISDTYIGIYPNEVASNRDDYHKKRKEELLIKVENLSSNIMPSLAELNKEATEPEIFYKADTVFTQKRVKVDTKLNVTFFEKIFGSRPPLGWMKADIYSGVNANSNDQLWRLSIRGGIGGSSIGYDSEVHSNLHLCGLNDALLLLANFWKTHEIQNGELSITIIPLLIKNRKEIKILQGYCTEYSVNSLAHIHIEGFERPLSIEQIIDKSLLGLEPIFIQNFKKAFLS